MTLPVTVGTGDGAEAATGKARIADIETYRRSGRRHPGVFRISIDGEVAESAVGLHDDSWDIDVGRGGD